MAENECESTEDALRRHARMVVAVEAIHQPRVFDGDGYSWTICVEDRQGWPCATLQAMERSAMQEATDAAR